MKNEVIGGYSHDALIEAEEALVGYIEKCEQLGIQMSDCMLFGMAQLYDFSDATAKDFKKLAGVAIKISMRENEEIPE